MGQLEIDRGASGAWLARSGTMCLAASYRAPTKHMSSSSSELTSISSDSLLRVQMETHENHFNIFGHLRTV